MLHIKVTGMDHSPTCKQKFCTYALHICDPCDGVKRWKHFSEYGHVINEIKGNESYDKMKANSVPSYTLLTPGIKPKVRVFVLESGHVAYQTKGEGFACIYHSHL